MKELGMIVLLGGLVFSSIQCSLEARADTQERKCALCGKLVSANEQSFSYPFICRSCLVTRGKGTPAIIISDDAQDSAIAQISGPNPSSSAGAVARRQVTYADAYEEKSTCLLPAAACMKRDVFDHVLNFDRFRSEAGRAVARRTKRMVCIRSGRTGQERKNKKAFKESIEDEARASRYHTWHYQVARDHSSVSVKSMLLPTHEETYKLREPFTKMFYRNGCVVFVLSKQYQVHDFSSGITQFFPFGKKDQLEEYLYNQGQGGQFKEYVNTSPFVGKKMTESLLIPTHHYALTDNKRVLLVGNDDGYIMKWELEAPVQALFARADEVAVITDRLQFIQDFSRHDEQEELTTADYPLDVLVVEKSEPRDLIRQGFVRIPVPEKSVDMFIRELASVPDSCTYDIVQLSSLEELTAHLTEGTFTSGRNFFCSLAVEQDEETREREAVVIITDDVPVKRGEDPWKEELVLNALQDRVWYRKGQVVTWDHEDLISFDYAKQEAKRFVLSPGIVREAVAEKMPELAFVELRQASS